ncbi:MAG: hypothetical protein DRH37_02870, partial [Deltaproteobacteria bacterium]
FEKKLFVSIFALLLSFVFSFSSVFYIFMSAILCRFTYIFLQFFINLPHLCFNQIITSEAQL